MSNPRTFGIDDVTVDPPNALDTVVLSAGQSLAAVARAAAVTEEQLTQCNPQLLLGRLPPQVGSNQVGIRIYVPRGKGELVRNRLSRVSGPEPDLESYAVKRGENIESIALRKGFSVEMLKSINRITDGEVIESGTVLLVPRTSSSTLEQEDLEEAKIAVVPPDVAIGAEQRRVFYRISEGDTLSSIAETFAVSRAEILENNSLDPSAKLQPSMLLQILIAKDSKPKNVHYREEQDMRVLVAGSDAFLDYFEGLRGNERLVVQAKNKETLATIGARHGVSVGMMERINRRSRRDGLVPGESVVVYVRRAGEQERVGSTR